MRGRMERAEEMRREDCYFPTLSVSLPSPNSVPDDHPKREPTKIGSYGDQVRGASWHIVSCNSPPQTRAAYSSSLSIALERSNETRCECETALTVVDGAIQSR